MRSLSLHQPVQYPVRVQDIEVLGNRYGLKPIARSPDYLHLSQK
ncbi:hypothetical protein [Coleofasciculus sp. FACHB-1120]|nr:hypothetical protein [Coleofasciculus sp. FACHB-1120]